MSNLTAWTPGLWSLTTNRSYIRTLPDTENTLSKWASWPAIWVMSWKTCVGSLLKKKKQIQVWRLRHLFFFSDFHLKTFQSEANKCYPQKNTAIEQQPFVHATVPLQKRLQSNYLLAFGLPGCRTNIGTDFFSLSKLLLHHTQVFDISHYLFMSSDTPAMSLISSLLSLWTPSPVILCRQSPQVPGYSFGPSSPLIQWTLPATQKNPKTCWASTGKILMAEDIILSPNKIL